MPTCSLCAEPITGPIFQRGDMPDVFCRSCYQDIEAIDAAAVRAMLAGQVVAFDTPVRTMLASQEQVDSVSESTRQRLERLLERAYVL